MSSYQIAAIRILMRSKVRICYEDLGKRLKIPPISTGQVLKAIGDKGYEHLTRWVVYKKDLE